MSGIAGRAAVCVLVVTALVFATAGVGAQTQTETGDRLVVNADGSGDYETISAALEAATAGQTVVVRPGTYEESLRIERDVRLVAPEGATLEGAATTGATAGIRIVGDAAPEIEGFTITEYRVGIDASGTSGDWLVRETQITSSRVIGVRATDTTGDWTLLDTVVRGTDGVGIGAFRSRGNWSVIGVTVSRTAGIGVNARNAGGDWRIVDSVIRETRNGTTLPPGPAGTGVRAVNTRGSWEITRSVFRNNTTPLAAIGAAPAGDASRVYWGAGANASCVGNVSCASPLASAPDVGAPNVTRPSGETTNQDGGSVPWLGVLGAGVLVTAVGGALAVRRFGRNTVIDAIEAVPVVVVGLIDDFRGGSGDAHRIVLANVDSQPVTCRVRCRTGEGVAFEYDLELDPDERREAHELPGDRPFELTVEVQNGGEQRTFETPTDVGVRVAAGGVELTT